MSAFFRGQSPRSVYVTLTVFAFIFLSWGLVSPQVFVVIRKSPLSPLRIINDAFLHCGAFALISFAACLLFATESPSRMRIVVGLLFVYGAVTELLQAHIPTRSCDALDLFANLTGVGVGAVLANRTCRAGGKATVEATEFKLRNSVDAPNRQGRRF